MWLEALSTGQKIEQGPSWSGPVARRSLDSILGVEKHLACPGPDIVQRALWTLIPGASSWAPASSSASINATGQADHPDFF